MKINSRQIQNQTRSISMQGCSEGIYFWKLHPKRPSAWDKIGDIFPRETHKLRMEQMEKFVKHDIMFNSDKSLVGVEQQDGS